MHYLVLYETTVDNMKKNASYLRKDWKEVCVENEEKAVKEAKKGEHLQKKILFRIQQLALLIRFEGIN